MKRLMMILMMAVAPLAAQADKPAEAPPAPSAPRVQRLFILKYADPRSIQRLLAVFDATCSADTDLHALSVTAPAATMRGVEDAINKLDVPSAATKNLDLTMQLVIGSDTDSLAASLPKDLEPVVAQLRNAFPFKNYRLLDVLTLRTRVGQRAGTDSSGGAVQVAGGIRPVTSTFNILSSSLSPDGTVRLDGVRATSRIPVETAPLAGVTFQELNLTTDVDIKEGQKVVIGRHGLNREQALFLVVTAKVVQ